MEKCAICGNSDQNKLHSVREMMFGTRQVFTYLECASCGCLQLLDVPANIEEHYQNDYYAYQPRRGYAFTKIIVQRLKYWAYFQSQLTSGSLGKICGQVIKGSRIPEVWPTLVKARITSGMRILDVGCGSGGFLNGLSRDGFYNLEGVDPFIASDISYGGRIRIYKCELSQYKKTCDFVTMHHAFEHVPNPEAELIEINRVLKPGGFALIRTPLAQSFAWKKYGVNWVQIDAPRHLFIQTPASMNILASRTGFVVEDIRYDSHDLQFTGSEAYCQDVPLTSKEFATLFTQDELAEFRAKAAVLNAQKQGDQAGFLLRKCN